MIKRWFVILILFYSVSASAQDSTALPSDTSKQTDILAKQRDSLAQVLLQQQNVKRQEQIAKWEAYPFTKNLFYRFQNPVRLMAVKRTEQGKEGLFYAAIGLLIFFALVKNNFARYLHDLFRLFFRSTLKQRQIKEQLIEANLPSLLFNLIFFIGAALFLNLLFQHFHLGGRYNFWILFFYTIMGLAAMYFIKFLSLKLCGWLFRLSDTTDAYTFIVFSTNKILGIALLPFIVLLAFTGGLVYQVSFTLSIIVVAILFAYRFFLSYSAIHSTD